MTPTRRPQPVPQTFVLDSEALALAVRGDRAMLARLASARGGRVDVITSPMTLIEAHDPRIPAARWNWVASRMRVATVGKDEARAAHELLTAAGLHGHKYAIDAVLAVVAIGQPGFVTVLTSDVDDFERLLPPTVLVRKV